MKPTCEQIEKVKKCDHHTLNLTIYDGFSRAGYICVDCGYMLIGDALTRKIRTRAKEKLKNGPLLDKKETEQEAEH